MIASHLTKDLSPLRQTIRELTISDEGQRVQSLLDELNQTSAETHKAAEDQAVSWVEQIRSNGDPGLMESLLAEYGLSTLEGVAMMSLAEAYLRVPDSETLDDLIADKLSAQDFAKHMGHSNSLMVNASTWGLMLTGGILTKSQERGLMTTLRSTVRRLGEPVIRVAVKRMMRLMGGQFVLGEDIESAMKTGRAMVKKGYTYSYDMLGEAALTQGDANRYYLAYADAIGEISKNATHDKITDNPGISVKLSALFSRYETLQHENVMDSLLSSIRSLCLMAKKANIGLNIDAEEVERLDISLDIIEALLTDPSLKGWDGLGIVVQAYGFRAPAVLDWLYETAKANKRKIMVRLVKGAYWDREIKRSQELGIEGYPVFTRKFNTDVSYLACADKLLAYRDVIYPQFATHNAHTVAYILTKTEQEPAKQKGYEFQRLHGMGDSLHKLVLKISGVGCRIYAPVGVHQDLLAYLVRRLLENGANASFVNQLLDENVEPRRIVSNPMTKAQKWLDDNAVLGVELPKDLFMPERTNSKGWDFQSPGHVAPLLAKREAFMTTQWTSKPLVSVDYDESDYEVSPVSNPANAEDKVGEVYESKEDLVKRAAEAAHAAQKDWAARSPRERSDCLQKAADLYEQNAPELLAILSREAGKTLQDGIAEIREAVDFLRYYAVQSENVSVQRDPLGVVACISPWNFPLAIFTGQLSAALSVGNAVLVKPAESTPIVASKGIEYLHQAGVPVEVCQFIPGRGRVVGEAFSQHPNIAGMVFTGSTQTAKRIETNIAASGRPEVPVIAETGGLNAMIVDSSALPEQAIIDIMASSFQSAGQRCSALRMLYVQEDVAPRFLKMLYGAMDNLNVGNPWQTTTDVGPIIDAKAKENIESYVQAHKDKVTKRVDLSERELPDGHFVAPTVIEVNGIEDLDREIFGPVLHVATFDTEKLPELMKDVNKKGYGLTFGMHTRIDSRVQLAVSNLHVGNMYVNRNQIGAIVGSQPFGGEGLSGTGPKAGGPNYLYRLTRSQRTDTDRSVIESVDVSDANAKIEDVAAPKALQKIINELKKSLDAKKAPIGELFPLGELAEQYTSVLSASRQRLLVNKELPGPTGEQNLYTQHGRGVILVATQDIEVAFEQVLQALYAGNAVVMLASVAEQNATMKTWLSQMSRVALWAETDQFDPAWLKSLQNFAGIAFWRRNSDDLLLAAQYRIALASRDDELLPLITETFAPYRYVHERHLCVNTTAAGGNVELLSSSESGVTSF